MILFTIYDLFTMDMMGMGEKKTPWSCRIYRLHLCRGVSYLHNECPGYETKKSNGEAPVFEL